MGNTTYKKRYISDIVSRLSKHYPTDTPENIRARAANIFNRSHRFTKKDGYTKKDTIFASSVENSVKMYVLRENLQKSIPILPNLREIFEREESHSSTFFSNVSLAAVDVGEINIEDVPEAIKASESFKDVFNNRSDLVLLDLILVVEGANANKDHFTAEELEASHKTLIGMPLTEEHLPTEIQGVFYDAQLVDVDVTDPETEEVTQKKAVRAQAVFYKHRFPDEADVIIGRATLGTLRFSMECYFEKAKCSECGEFYDSVWDYCDHLWERFEPYSPTSRILANIKFVGGSYVRYPAEKSAVLLDFKDFSADDLAAAASSEGKPVYHCKLNDVHFAWTDRNSATQSSDSNIEGEESMDFEKLLAKYPDLKDKIAELAQAKADEIVAAMESTSEKEELEQTIATLTEQNEALSTEVDELKTERDERKALDRANAFITDLEKDGIDLGSDDDKNKLIALFLKSSDEDAETLMSFLRKTKASEDTDDADDSKDESGEGDSDDNSEASEEDDSDEDNEDKDAEASDDSDDDDGNEAEAGGQQLPLGSGDDYDTAVANRYGQHLKGEAVKALSALAKKFDSEQSD